MASLITLNTPSLITLYTLNGIDGGVPEGSLIEDANGDLLFGTTVNGGANGDGTVFELSPGLGGYVLSTASFDGTDGANPIGGLVADANGDLFGTAELGGASGDGVVFEIAKTANGYAGMPAVLVSFNGTDGANPFGSLIADANGDLFGTTEAGGASGDGVVFEIAKTANGYAGTPAVLVSFNGTDGANPYGGLVADANGDLFGTTEAGGASGDGVVFEIAKTANGYAGTPAVLVSFNGTDGANPYGGLVADANGDLFGTTEAGGASGDGVVFEIAKTANGYAGTPAVLVSFNGTDGANPYGGLIADANGDLFGTTANGGTSGDGVVFEIAKTANGYAGTPAVLVSFNGNDGAAPIGGLVANANGDLFGTTADSVPIGVGTVFEVLCFLAGTGIATPSGEVPVQALRAGDLVCVTDGRTLPVRWLGRRTVALRFADPLRVLPIRIRAGALDERQPLRDLLLSPDHALWVDGVLIQAGALVNDRSIVRETAMPAVFTYYHVELSEHALVLAEGVPAETFIDHVERMAFDNWAEHAALPEAAAPIVEMDLPRAKSQRQVPGSIRARLAARTAALFGTDAAAA